MSNTPCICLFSTLYAPSMGGVETYTANLARALVAQGMRVIVATLNTHHLEEITNEDGVEVVRLPCRNLLNNRYPIARKNGASRCLWAWLEAQPIDYVVVNARFYSHSYQGLAFARSKGVAPVIIEHGSAHLTLGNPLLDCGVQAVEHAITKAERRFGASSYAVSRKASAWLSHFDIVSHGELANSIDADAYANRASARSYRDELGLSPQTFVVAFVGRLVGEKGVFELAQAAEMLDEADDVAILVAGDGPLRESLKPFESKRFHLLGSLPKEDVAALLLQADALCLPSRSEGFATSLLEAAACSTPVLVTDVGGVDELIPSAEFGTVMPDRTPEALCKALRAASDDREHTAQQGRNAARLVRTDYSWKQTALRTVVACRQAQEGN